MIRLGTAGWSIPAALRPHFPSTGTQLEKYATRLNAAEINSSFHRPHRRETYERWAASVPKDFRFAVKLPKTITHENRLADFRGSLARFLGEISGLGAKLGVILMQLPPSLVFDAKRARALFTALGDYKVACEPRHASWFAPDAEAVLRRHRIARVAADPPRDPGDGAPGGDNTLAYWRWHGSPRLYWSAYADARLHVLARAMAAHPAKEQWCIFDNTASGAALDDALRLKAMQAAASSSGGTGTKASSTPYYRAKQEDPMARKYSKGASKKVERAMHEMKRGELHSGSKKGPKVKSRKQAIAIGLSEARAEGKKAPKKRASKKSAAKKTTRKAAKKTTGRKSAKKKSSR